MRAANQAPRCTAHSKRTGERCKAPAVNGWTVCRMHGAGGGHKAGPSHPSWKHGMRSREWIEVRKYINELTREAREIETRIEAEGAGVGTVRRA
ncbi:hypothetical protein EU800_23610 [Tropicimonas sp. IMCC6043]|nr:hypothetical protein EU800_23610 [Tropicimonas sp. IMCC6043]